MAADEAADAKAVALTLQQWSDSDLRNWQSAQCGRPIGVFGRWEGEPKDWLVDEGLIEDLAHFKGNTTDSGMDLLRLTDIHQIMVWLVCTLREASMPGESFSARRQLLLTVLGKDTMEESFESMALFLYGRCTERTAEGRVAADYKTCNQPAAFQRLLEGRSFSACMTPIVRQMPKMSPTCCSSRRWSTVPMTSSCSGCRGTVFAWSLEVQLYPFDDPVFRQKVDAMWKKRKAKERDKFPRIVILINERIFGVGALGPGAYEKGEFLGFYLGISLRKDEEPHGRYVVTSLG